MGSEAALGYGSTSSWHSIPESGTRIGVVGQTFTEDFADTTSGASLVRGWRPNTTNSNGYGIDYICESATDSQCIKDSGVAEMLLPACSIDSTSLCVEGFYIERNGIRTAGLFNRVVQSKTFPGNPSLGIPNGYNSSLWTVPGMNHEGNENTYSIYASYKAHLSGNLQKFRVIVNPYVLKRDSNYRVNGYSESPSGDGGQRIVGTNGATGCAWVEDGVCGFPTNFTTGDKVGVVVRVSKQVKGWLNGRVQKPEISFSALTDALNRLEISGTPTTVQKVYGKTLISTGDQEVVDSIRYLGWDESQQYLGTTTADDEKSIPVFELWRKYIPDQAESMRTYWSFAVAGSSDQVCFADAEGVVGIVTTNATVYEPAAPSFLDGELQYKVAGVPLKPDGERFSGSYDLVIDSKVARCLYKFSTAPIKASVSISAEDGNRSIETTVTGEKNGWFSLGAYGFGFSSPTIRVKLSQEEPLNKTSSEKEEVTERSGIKAKKVSITCVKGQKSTVVKSIKPKCPKGYKKA